MKLGRKIRIAIRIVLVVAVAVLVMVAGAATWIRYAPAPEPAKSALLLPIQHVEVTPGQGIVNVLWSEVDGAIGYQVLRSDKPDRDFIVAGSPWGRTWTTFPVFGYHFVSRFVPTGENYGRVPHPPFVDTNIKPGNTYYYKIRATDGSGWTEPSPALRFSVPEKTPTSGIQIYVDAAHAEGTLEHKWEMMTGSENLSLLTKHDLGPDLKEVGSGLRSAIKLAHDNLGMQYVVAHGILDDDLGMYREDSLGKPIYNWAGIDSVYDILRAVGIKPYVQLTFMPKALARDPLRRASKYFPAGDASVSPPRDFARWSAMVSALATHLIERYGKEEVESWPFAVWNQPDVCMGGFICYWSGNQEDYFRLYDYTAQAIKTVDNKLRVGGPVTQYTYFVEPFLKHVTTRNFATGGTSSPIDFLDFHIYQQPTANWQPLLRRYGLENLPIYYTEWGVRQFLFDPVNDLPYGAAWVAHNLYQSLNQVTSISYWTVSDYFGKPRSFFYGGTGLIGLEGIRKPRYWAYYLLHQLGNERLTLEGQGDGFGGLVTGWATVGDHGGVRIMVSNVTNDQLFAEGNTLLARHISITVAGLPSGAKISLKHFRVDNTHSNVYAEWQKIGQPKWPSAAQVDDLRQHDVLQMLEPVREYTTDGSGKTIIDFDLPMPALSLLVLEPSS